MYPPPRLTVSKYSAICLAIAFLVAALLRFHNLDLKPYWEDEIYTATRLAGFQSYAIEQAIQGKIISVAEIQRFFHVELFQGWGDFLRAIASRPEQAPLYYILARIWAGLFGSSPIAMRALPAGLSLLALGCLYKLAMALFKQHTGAIATVCLASMSPLLIRYAQENRAYSLWIVFILLSCIALLRAIRLRQLSAWLSYGGTLICGLLTHWLFLLVALAQGSYLFFIFVTEYHESHQASHSGTTLISISNQANLPKFRRLVLIAAIFSLPLIYLVSKGILSAQSHLQWLADRVPFEKLALSWELNLMRTFSSATFSLPGHPLSNAIIIGVILILAAWQMTRTHPWQTWTLPFFISGYCGLPFLIADLTQGGMRSVIDRYLLPFFVMLIIIMGQGIGTFLNEKLAPKFGVKNAILLAGTSLLLPIFLQSSLQDLEAYHWWQLRVQIPEISEMITLEQESTVQNPALIITDHRWADTFSLMNRLSAQDKLLWVPFESPLESSDLPKDGKVFLLNPSEILRSQVAQAYDSSRTLQLDYEKYGYELWQMVPGIAVEKARLGKLA